MGTHTNKGDSILSLRIEKQKKEMLKHLKSRNCKNERCEKVFKVNKGHTQEYCSQVCETGAHDGVYVVELFTVSSMEKRQLNKNVASYGALNTDF